VLVLTCIERTSGIISKKYGVKLARGGRFTATIICPILKVAVTCIMHSLVNIYMMSPDVMHYRVLAWHAGLGISLDTFKHEFFSFISC
jgi:hypoxanthine phosphoribosyltransferase